MRINIIGSTGKMDGNATEYSLIPQSIIDFWRMNVTDSHPFSTQSQHVQLPKSALQIEQWISRCRSHVVINLLLVYAFVVTDVYTHKLIKALAYFIQLVEWVRWCVCMCDSSVVSNSIRKEIKGQFTVNWFNGAVKVITHCALRWGEGGSVSRGQVVDSTMSLVVSLMM